MSARLISRRTALSLLATLPAGARVFAQTTPPRARRMFAGAPAFLLEPDGTVMGWGLGTVGPLGGRLGLGQNDRMMPSTAYTVPGLRTVRTMAAAANAAFAVLTGGEVVAWGSNAHGLLGNTSLAELEVTADPRAGANAPVTVPGITDAVTVASYGDHVLALARDGRVYAWGFGDHGQLGIGPMPIVTFKTHAPGAPNFVPYPVRIPALSEVVSIAAGDSHSLAVLKDGTVRAWGANRWGQVGDGTTVDRLSPVVVPGIRSAVAAVAGGELSMVLLSDGTVMTWGYGNGGLGRKVLTSEAPYPTPALVEGVAGVRELACGHLHALALTAGGTIISWGDSQAGEVGHSNAMPAPIPRLTNVRTIAAAGGSSYAVLADGTIMIWGGVPIWARVDGGDIGVSHTPIPLVIKGLRNP